jgi:hypothetical protein
MCNFKADLAVLETLSAHGVDLVAKDNGGKSILHHGAIPGSLSMEILNFVLGKYLLHLDDRDKEGETPLLYASEAANSTYLPETVGRILWSICGISLKRRLSSLKNEAKAVHTATFYGLPGLILLDQRPH